MKKKTLDEIYAHAIAEYPRECCGVVIAVGRKEKYVPCGNVATTPEDHFVIDPRDLSAAGALGRVVAVAHSHPDTGPQPSPADAAQARAWGLPWVIVAVHTDPARPDDPPVVTGDHIFTPDTHVPPMRGREFVFGTQDCYTLVQDFYEQEMGVKLPDFAREDKFWERGENLYMDNFASCGFEQIPTPTERGDIILMAIRSEIVNHAGIWLDDRGSMLHHPYNHLSEKVVYGGYWAENTRLFIRKVR